MATTTKTYSSIIVTTTPQIGIIKFNRPSTLNSFGGSLIPETIHAVRELNDHPTTIFTVLTGEGRFFSSGADIRGDGSIKAASDPAPGATDSEKKIAYLHRFVPAVELLRLLITHRKVFILALNGPAVGGGAAWFTGVADVVVASPSVYLQSPFSALGLVPEFGSAVSFAQNMGVQRTNDFFMFGDRVGVKELQERGIVQRVFDGKGEGGFLGEVRGWLEEMLQRNDGGSMMGAKELQNKRLMGERLLAVMEAWNGLAERFVTGVPTERLKARGRALEAQSKERSSKI